VEAFFNKKQAGTLKTASTFIILVLNQYLQIDDWKSLPAQKSISDQSEVLFPSHISLPRESFLTALAVFLKKSQPRLAKRGDIVYLTCIYFHQTTKTSTTRTGTLAPSKTTD